VDAKRKRFSSRDHSYLPPSKREKSKAPLLLRILAWCGVILLFFVAGYVGTSSILGLLDARIFDKQGSVETEGGTSPRTEGTLGDVLLPEGGRPSMQRTTLSLFYPKNGVIEEEKADFIVRTREDNIQEAVLKLLALSGLFNDTVEVKHVFRNVDTVFLDFSSSFVSALSAAGASASTLVITGIVRTMCDNFSPISKVRFLVDSKIESTGSPVDLTATWQLSAQR
jgi:hypothetical protein